MSYFNTTLKRNSKLDLSRPDLVKLVSVLEGELQAREIAIAVFKSEQIKRLLNPEKLPQTISGFRQTKQLNLCNPNQNSNANQELASDQTIIKYSSTDPLVALSRDCFAVYEPSLDYGTTLALYNIKIFQLENLIHNQNHLRQKLNDQLKLLESRYESLLAELDEERKKNLRLQTQYQDYDRIKLEQKIQSLNQTIEENKEQVKQMIMTLLDERKHLILKLIEEKHQNEELEQDLTSEKGKVAEMVEGLEDESKRSLQMEAELEKYLNDFEKERNEFKVKLQISEAKNADLINEIERLKSTVETLQNQLSLKNSNNSTDTTLATAKSWNIGEGVRSSIVAMPIGSKVHSSVNPVYHPKASVAQPIISHATNVAASTGSVVARTVASSIQTSESTSSINNNNIILPPPSIPVPQPKQQQQNSHAPSALKVSLSSTTSSNQNSSTISNCSNNVPQISSLTNKFNNTLNNESISINDSNNPLSTNTTIASKSSTGPSATTTNTVVKQTVKFYESSANNNQNKIITTTTSASSTSTISNTSGNSINNKKPTPAGVRPTPPPIPPNKPSIKPVLPQQAAIFLPNNLKNNNTKESCNNKMTNNSQTTAAASRLNNHHVASTTTTTTNAQTSTTTISSTIGKK